MTLENIPRRTIVGAMTMLKASKESRAALQRVLHLGQASGKPGEIYYP